MALNSYTLIDSRSTYNFLDATTAKRLRCELLKILPLVVGIADGAQLECQTLCRGFTWSLIETEGITEYTTDAYIVPLGSYDMVLGIQWLSTLGPILWNFEDLSMEFFLKGRKHLLQGIKKTKVGWTKGKNQKILNQAIQLFAVHLVPIQLNLALGQTEVKDPQLPQLLQEYADIFEEPRCLPPHRSHDHKITLKEGTAPRYPGL